VLAHWILFDDEAVVRCGSAEEAQARARSIEFGEIPMASWLRQSIGLGDTIALSGAAAVLSDREGGITLPVRPENMISVASIFADCHNIDLVDADEYLKHVVQGNLLVEPGHIFLRDTYLDQYQRIYKRFGIAYEHRWESSLVPAACEKVEQLPVPEGEYAFVHDDPRRKYLIDRDKITSGLTVYEPEFVPGQSILAFRDIIENAVELDFMDSCLFNLAEQLEPRGKLFLHRYPRPFHRLANNYKTRHHWADVW